MKNGLRLTVFSILIFSMMSYWGIRARDNEVIFRTTQALATSGSFAVSQELSFWRGFGLATGRDGKRYSIFGPGQAVIAVPLYKLAELVNASQWHLHANGLVSTSFYTNNGLRHFLSGHAPEDPAPHASRMVASLLNIIFASLCVFVFFLTIKALTRSDQAAVCTGILFAFGSLVLPYSGTFFSEMLATFFVMLSLYLLVPNDLSGRKHNRLYVLMSGVLLGLGTATHITAVLFAPFFVSTAALRAQKIHGHPLKIRSLICPYFQQAAEQCSHCLPITTLCGSIIFLKPDEP